MTKATDGLNEGPLKEAIKRSERKTAEDKQQEAELDELLGAARALVEKDRLKGDLAARKKYLDGEIKAANEDYDRVHAILAKSVKFRSTVYQVGGVAVSVWKSGAPAKVHVEIVDFHAERETTPVW